MWIMIISNIHKQKMNNRQAKLLIEIYTLSAPAKIMDLDFNHSTLALVKIAMVVYVTRNR